jgi:hypothetical protein
VRKKSQTGTHARCEDFHHQERASIVQPWVKPGFARSFATRRVTTASGDFGESPCRAGAPPLAGGGWPIPAARLCHGAATRMAGSLRNPPDAHNRPLLTFSVYLPASRCRSLCRHWRRGALECRLPNFE